MLMSSVYKLVRLKEDDDDVNERYSYLHCLLWCAEIHSVSIGYFY